MFTLGRLQTGSGKRLRRDLWHMSAARVADPRRARG